MAGAQHHPRRSHRFQCLDALSRISGTRAGGGSIAGHRRWAGGSATPRGRSGARRLDRPSWRRDLVFALPLAFSGDHHRRAADLESPPFDDEGWTLGDLGSAGNRLDLHDREPDPPRSPTAFVASPQPRPRCVLGGTRPGGLLGAAWCPFRRTLGGSASGAGAPQPRSTLGRDLCGDEGLPSAEPHGAEPPRCSSDCPASTLDPRPVYRRLSSGGVGPVVHPRRYEWPPDPRAARRLAGQRVVGGGGAGGARRASPTRSGGDERVSAVAPSHWTFSR